MVRTSKKWLLKFRQKKSGKIDLIAENDIQDDKSVLPSSLDDSLYEALNNMSCSIEDNNSDDVNDGVQKIDIIKTEENKNGVQNLPHLGHVDSKKMCLKLLRKYSRLAMDEQNFSEDMSTQRSSYDGSVMTDDETEDSGQVSSSDIPTVSTQPTITSTESSIGLEQDETSVTATFASPYSSQYTNTKESPFSVLLGPLLCGLATNVIAKTSDESSCSYLETPLYSKVRFVANCGRESINNGNNNTRRNFCIKNITVDNDPIVPSSFSISEVSDVTEIETSFTNDDEDIVTIFTCRSVDDKGVTLYSAISVDQEDVLEHTGRYDI